MGCDRKTGCDILNAIFPRLFFVIQIFLSVWRVASVKGNIYWCLLLLLIALLLETVFTIYKRKGQECKWASTSFIAFLIGAVPPLWLLTLHRFHRYNAVHPLQPGNITLIDDDDAEGLSDLFGLRLPIFLKSDMWVKVLQQAFILMLIPVRWIMPRGQFTRDRLSQILLVYAGIGGDIISLLDLYDMPGVRKDKFLFMSILAIWSISLIQFVFLLSTNSSRKARLAFNETTPKQQDAITEKGSDQCCNSSVFDLMITLCLQDFPFLCTRLYVMARFKQFSNSSLFFLSKNVFVIILQFYRMCIIMGCFPPETDEDGDGLADDRQDVNDTPVAIYVSSASKDATGGNKESG